MGWREDVTPVAACICGFTRRAGWGFPEGRALPRAAQCHRRTEIARRTYDHIDVTYVTPVWQGRLALLVQG
jgi:hypothetical protein